VGVGADYNRGGGGPDFPTVADMSFRLIDMTQGKRLSRKTSRIVRTPATRFGHLQKRLLSNKIQAKALPRKKKP
jgi:hypothetical protein